MNNLVAFNVPLGAIYGAMASRIPPGSPESPEAIGKRLRALRDALDLSQDDIAASIGMASKSASWSLYENGDIIPAHNALALCRRYGVTMDWLYRGLWATIIPFDLAEKIRHEELKAQEPQPRKVKRRS